jgi:hypothetical protein
MKDGWKSLALVLAGVLLGACVKDLVSSRANAAGGGGRYLVIDGSFSAEGYQNDMNDKAREGYRFVGAIPFGNTAGKLVFEK